jgi:hypothetical protein
VNQLLTEEFIDFIKDNRIDMVKEVLSYQNEDLYLDDETFVILALEHNNHEIFMLLWDNDEVKSGIRDKEKYNNIYKSLSIKNKVDEFNNE